MNKFARFLIIESLANMFLSVHSEFCAVFNRVNDTLYPWMRNSRQVVIVIGILSWFWLSRFFIIRKLFHFHSSWELLFPGFPYFMFHVAISTSKLHHLLDWVCFPFLTCYSTFYPLDFIRKLHDHLAPGIKSTKNSLYNQLHFHSMRSLIYVNILTEIANNYVIVQTEGLPASSLAIVLRMSLLNV